MDISLSRALPMELFEITWSHIDIQVPTIPIMMSKENQSHAIEKLPFQ